jgi:hypothetical protein
MFHLLGSYPDKIRLFTCFQENMLSSANFLNFYNLSLEFLEMANKNISLKKSALRLRAKRNEVDLLGFSQFFGFPVGFPKSRIQFLEIASKAF